jgi:hypothetical protein
MIAPGAGEYDEIIGGLIGFPRSLPGVDVELGMTGPTEGPYRSG